MKLHTCLLTVIAVVTFSTTMFADGPFDRFLPRGRLLKKLRDDIVGASDQKQPTLAKRTDAADQKGPTPAVRPQNHRGQPTPVNRSDQQRDTENANRPSYFRSGADGFGMVVVTDKKNNVYVAQVTPDGNAADVGLQRGDVIVEAGGVELTSIQEFQEIAKMLGAGDQLDLKIARRGRENTVTLQHGQPPKLEDLEAEQNPLSNADATSHQRPARMLESDFSFVPPADEDSRPGMKSVVEQSLIPVRSASTQRRAMGQLQSNSRPVAPQQLQQTVAQQQQQILMLQRQLEQLRRQHGVTGSGVRVPRRGR